MKIPNGVALRGLYARIEGAGPLVHRLGGLTRPARFPLDSVSGLFWKETA
jgi:hypothetical protein